MHKEQLVQFIVLWIQTLLQQLFTSRGAAAWAAALPDYLGPGLKFPVVTAFLALCAPVPREPTAA